MNKTQLFRRLKNQLNCSVADSCNNCNRSSCKRHHSPESFLPQKTSFDEWGWDYPFGKPLSVILERAWLRVIFVIRILVGYSLISLPQVMFFNYFYPVPLKIMTFASLEGKKTLSAFLASTSFQGAIKSS